MYSFRSLPRRDRAYATLQYGDVPLIGSASFATFIKYKIMWFLISNNYAQYDTRHECFILKLPAFLNWISKKD